MRHQKSLYELINALKKNRDVDWGYWKNRELKSLCKFFVEKKFCKEHKLDLHQYIAFAEVVTDFYNNKESMLFQIINKSPGLKNYLQTRSVFSIHAYREGDWLNREMIKILEVTDSDIEKIFKPEFVPQSILDKLAIFDPEPIGFETDSIRIEYDFWGFDGPIKVVDTDWLDDDKTKIDVPRFLSQYEPIQSGVPVTSSYTNTQRDSMDEDLPF